MLKLDFGGLEEESKKKKIPSVIEILIEDIRIILKDVISNENDLSKLSKKAFDIYNVTLKEENKINVNKSFDKFGKFLKFICSEIKKKKPNYIKERFENFLD